MTHPWTQRDEWAEQRRTPYADDVDQVVEAVSARVADYATPAEITQAYAELRDHWRTLGSDLRAANAAALEVFPLHGHRARRRDSLSVIWKLRDALSDADRAVVERAERTKDCRSLTNQAAGQLAEDHLNLWTASRLLERLPAGACPTWRAIVGRWREARQQAAQGYAAQVRQRPVDDAAWRKELDRRAQIEAWRATGHGVVGRSA